jgi:hypothetical protein
VQLGHSGIHLIEDGVHRLAEPFVLTPGAIEFLAMGKFRGCPFVDTFKIDSAHDDFRLRRFALRDVGTRPETIDRVDRALDHRPKSGNLCHRGRIRLHFAYACARGKRTM